jgi:hypothetical protein
VWNGYLKEDSFSFDGLVFLIFGGGERFCFFLPLRDLTFVLELQLVFSSTCSAHIPKKFEIARHHCDNKSNINQDFSTNSLLPLKTCSKQ